MVSVTCAVAAFVAISRAPAGAQEDKPFQPASGKPFSVSARSVAFYGSRYILTADGDVEVNLGDGARLTGNTFAMDIRLNRFVIAGSVKLYAAGQEYDGAAFADFFDFDRQYFVPSGPAPDRWTYSQSDYAHPFRGREMPGDTYYLPDLSNERVFVFANKAYVEPRVSIRFIHPKIRLGVAFVPFPSYFLEFGPNPNYAQNSLRGAYVDGPWDALGGDHALASAHLRYDPANKVYFAYEQHQFSDNHYLVASISPLTQVFKQYNFIGLEHMPKFDIAGSFQMANFQHDFKEPLSSTAYATTTLTAGLPHSSLQLQTHSYYDSLLAQPPPGINGLLYYGDMSHPWNPDHPDDAMLTWSSFQNRIFKLPIFFKTRVAMGFAHDGLNPPQVLENVFYRTIWNNTIGFNVQLPSYKLLRDYSGLGHDIYFNATFDKQRESFSLPHHVDTTITSFSLSRQFDPRFIMLVNYQITNTGDFYGARQSEVYQPNTVYLDPITMQPVPAWSSFRGFATQRSLVEQFVFQPSNAVAANLSFRQNHDYPIPLAGQVFENNIGFEPYQATLDMRFRISPTIVLDLSRSYFFNFDGAERWSPTFGIQVLR